MIKLKKKLYYSNKKQIFRLLLSDTDKLLIEERDSSIKQVFFNCIDLSGGKTLFEDFQHTEKYWIGVESFYNDIILFHKFQKPDMPMHKGIIAFDVNSKKVIWEYEDCVYILAYRDTVYAYRQEFGGRKLVSISVSDGILTELPDEEADNIDAMGQLANDEFYTKGYLFPEILEDEDNGAAALAVRAVIQDKAITVTGRVEYISFMGAAFFNVFTPGRAGKLNNLFFAVDNETGKVIFNEELDTEANAYVPDSFFIKNNRLFLLKGKTGVIILEMTER